MAGDNPRHLARAGKDAAVARQRRPLLHAHIAGCCARGALGSGCAGSASVQAYRCGATGGGGSIGRERGSRRGRSMGVQCAIAGVARQNATRRRTSTGYSAIPLTRDDVERLVRINGILLTSRLFGVLKHQSIAARLGDFYRDVVTAGKSNPAIGVGRQAEP